MLTGAARYGKKSQAAYDAAQPNSKTDGAGGFRAEAFSPFSQDVDLGNLLEFVALLALTFLSLLTMDIFSM